MSRILMFISRYRSRGTGRLKPRRKVFWQIWRHSDSFSPFWSQRLALEHSNLLQLSFRRKTKISSKRILGLTTLKQLPAWGQTSVEKVECHEWFEDASRRGYLNFEPEFEPGFEPGSEPGFEPGSELGSEPGSEWGSEPGFEPGSTPLRTQTVSRHKFFQPFWSCDLFFSLCQDRGKQGWAFANRWFKFEWPFCLMFSVPVLQ